VRLHALVEDLGAARAAVDGGATVVQLRRKGATTAELVEAGRGFGDLGAAFVVNDDVEAALRLGADGVHLGRTDEGAGPVWATPSKPDADPTIGLEGLAVICSAVSVAVVAIGGVDASNAAECIRAGAAGVAVIRAARDLAALREAVDAAL
jgi:thiamine-phosphate pyrophosphorylase